MSKRLAVIFVSVFAAVAAIIPAVGGAEESDTSGQVVDNSDGDRFAASRSWKTGDSGEGINGEDYRFAPPADKAAHALFKVEIPEDGEYTVYARWPKVEGLNDSVPVGVETAYGTKWKEVNQRENGGRWVRVGEFEMRQDEEFPVRISRKTQGKGIVVADAVKVEQVSSYEEPDAAPRIGDTTASEQQRTARSTGSAVVQEAERYLGTRYGPMPAGGGPQYCKPFKMMDCSCLTMTVFKEFGKRLYDDPAVQVRNGRSVRKSDLRPGDLVFFDTASYPHGIDHVGIYAGNGVLIHASNYFGKVLESDINYIPGYADARRLV